MRIALSLALGLALLASPTPARAEQAAPVQENWATARARVLTQEGKAHREKGNVGLAVTRFNDALSIDATFGDAYLALASLREATGELEEADKVLSLALEHIPGFDPALFARAELYGRAKRFDAATSVLLGILAREPEQRAALTKVIETASKAGRFPVALAAARRLALLLGKEGDLAAAKDARITVRALTLLVAEADPVCAKHRATSVVRRALARAAR